MGEKTGIEWTDATWNPWHGCKKVSEGCKNCYMFRDKKRYGQDPTKVVRASDKTFYAPLKLKEPQRVFTCSWSDFFIEEADAWRDEAFAVMALTPQHTYQVLTKRPDRMLEYFAPGRQHEVVKAACRILDQRTPNQVPGRLSPHMKWLADYDGEWPPKNVHLGVSVEDRDTYIHRLPYLAMTPGATKFVSLEPLLGDLGDLMLDGIFEGVYQWAIVGTKNRRVAKLEWIESIVEQCKAASVPVFVKQIELGGKVEKDIDQFPAHLQIREFPNV